MQYLFFILAIFLFAVLTLAMKKKKPEFYEKHKAPYYAIKDAARKKIIGAKEDHKIPALLFLSGPPLTFSPSLKFAGVAVSPSG